MVIFTYLFRFPNYLLNSLFTLTKAAKPTVFLKLSCKAVKARVLTACHASSQVGPHGGGADTTDAQSLC